MRRKKPCGKKKRKEDEKNKEEKIRIKLQEKSWFYRHVTSQTRAVYTIHVLVVKLF